jgi:RNA polymerase sigma-70 factor (ECF subfamily)
MLTDLDDWFVLEVLPLEAALVRYLRRNARDGDDVADLRQEVYVRLYEAARQRRPDLVKPFVFAAARNLLIDRARRAQIVSIEAFADLDVLDLSQDDLTPERHASGSQELHLLQAALEELPARCREVVKLRKIDGLSQREVAAHMGITEDTVEKQIGKGMRVLADALLLKGVVTGMPTLRRKIGKKDGKA